MDALVITPSVLIIIESKNFSGNLLYDQHINRLIRKYQNQEESFPDPIMQAKRQQIFLHQWLELHKFRSCPIEFLISLGQATSIIKTNGRPDIFQKILYAEQIPQKVEKLHQLYSQKIYTPYLINKLLQTLLAEHNPITINISKKYGISKKEIITGVQCPCCSTQPMIRLRGYWYCSNCEARSSDAHVKAINDYLLLYDSMTNKQCRDFLHFSSINLCTRMLRELKLPSLGSGKHKIYYRKENTGAALKIK